jgi:hypothetical protein
MVKIMMIMMIVIIMEILWMDLLMFLCGGYTDAIMDVLIDIIKKCL